MSRLSRLSDIREEILREQIHRQPVDHAYLMASRIIEELQNYFRELESELLAMGASTRIQGGDNVAICAETGVPHLAWQSLQALARLTDALDPSHAGVLSAFAIRAQAVMNERLLVDGWVDVSWIAEGMAGLANDCRDTLDILGQKISMLAVGDGSHRESLQQAKSKMQVLCDKIGSSMARRDVMAALVEADIASAALLRQEDWAKLLGVTTRMISNYPAWKQLKEFKKSSRMSLKSPHSLADVDLTPDDGDDDE